MDSFPGGGWGLIESATNFWFWSFSDFCSTLSFWDPDSSYFIPLFPEFLRQESYLGGASLKKILISKGKEYIFPLPSLGYQSSEKAQEERLSAESNWSASRLTSHMNLWRDECVLASLGDGQTKVLRRSGSLTKYSWKNRGRVGLLKSSIIKKSIHSSGIWQNLLHLAHVCLC